MAQATETLHAKAYRLLPFPCFALCSQCPAATAIYNSGTPPSPCYNGTDIVPCDNSTDNSTDTGLGNAGRRLLEDWELSDAALEADLLGAPPRRALLEAPSSQGNDTCAPCGRFGIVVNGTCVCRPGYKGDGYACSGFTIDLVKINPDPILDDLFAAAKAKWCAPGCWGRRRGGVSEVQHARSPTRAGKSGLLHSTLLHSTFGCPTQRPPTQTLPHPCTPPPKGSPSSWSTCQTCQPALTIQT
jgi:hypothetical protein